MSSGVSEPTVVIAGSETAGMGALAESFDAVTDYQVTAVSTDSLPEEGVADAAALVVADDPPTADAVETYRRVRDAGWLLPVLVVGDGAAPRRVEQALKAGVTEYLPNWSGDRAAELDARVSAHVETPSLDGAAQAERWRAIVGTLAHDAKNPLNVISGRLELLDGDETHTDAIQRSVDRVESLLDEASAVASISCDEDAVEAVDLGESATAVWRAVGGPAERLTVESEATVEAHPDCLRLVLERLLENVAVHAGDDATATVARTDGGFYVADDGPGLPDVDDRLFEQGYGTAREGEGYGLFVAATAAAAHGWDITLGTSADGGARFDVRTY